MKIDSASFLRSAVDPRGFIVDQRPQIAFAGGASMEHEQTEARYSVVLTIPYPEDA